MQKQTMQTPDDKFLNEVSDGKRFEFGKNWKNFLSKLSDDRIRESEKALKTMLELESLQGKSFLDVGSGSGLSSLAARNLGADVVSFDFDPSSVWCTKELQSRYDDGSGQWKVLQGSILDSDFLSSLGTFDIVYSWGVLHHTGQMWYALDMATRLVKEGGLLHIAIYNDQGYKSHIWWLVKWVFNKLPGVLKKPYAYTLGFFVIFLMLIKYSFKLKPMLVLKPIFTYKKSRGMTLLNDMIDWYGGFPYEFVRYDTLKNYLEAKGFTLQKGYEASSAGTHEMVLLKQVHPDS